MLTHFAMLGVAVLLVILNGFFVAAEFALVKIRPSQIDEMVRQKRVGATTARWLWHRLDKALSACQLGITMASLGLGWVGEPAFAHLLEPVFHGVGITSAALIHTFSFIIAFTIITAAHLVIGEQAPKIFAIRRPEPMTLWCAPLLKFFYVISYPLLVALDGSTKFLLRRVGVEGASEHDTPHSQEEIRALLGHAHAHGELSRAEHRLLDAVFEFDDTVSRQIMLPRVEIVFLRLDDPTEQIEEAIRTSKHTRYPVCEGSLDNVVGVVHIKDLIGRALDSSVLREVARPVRFIPESMPVSRLLKQFQSSRQHLSLVNDEHGTVIGMVTMENVIERIIGCVQDEFDDEKPTIVVEDESRFMVLGSAPIASVNRKAGLDLLGHDVDTMSGLVVEVVGRMPDVGATIEFEGASVEILETSDTKVERMRLVIRKEGTDDHASSTPPAAGA